ncbi:MAG: apolipoprotein N-acyltransferase [Mycobacteriales bacterium]
MARPLRVAVPVSHFAAVGTAPALRSLGRASSGVPRVLRPAPRRLGWRVLAGLAGGFAEFATAPPLNLWPLGVVGAAALTLACLRARPRDGALAGLGYGLALFVPLLSWLHPVGLDAWLLLAAVQSLWLALLGAALAATSRLPGWPVWAACLWVGEEWARGRVPFGGFTWGRLAFGQAHSPLTGYAALGGAPLLTFVVGLAGALALWVALAASRRRRLAASGGLLVLACLLAGGLGVVRPTAGQPSPSGPAYATIAAVQGGVPRLGLPSVTQASAVLENHLAETAKLARQIASGARPAPALVIWPEDSVGFDPTRIRPLAAVLDQAARAVGAPILIGAVLDGPGQHFRNAGVVWTPTGPAGTYVKRHLVPFGEYIPFRSLIGGWIGRFSLIPENFVPGHRVGLLQAGPVRFGEVICFEVTFDAPVRQAVRAGGRLLVVQTNDATFESPGQRWNVGESAQQLAIAQLRAVEHARAVVVASTSGVSALISPNGRLIAHTDVFSQGVLEARLPLRNSLTLADRVGPAPEYLFTAVGFAALAYVLAGWALRRRR